MEFRSARIFAQQAEKFTVKSIVDIVRSDESEGEESRERIEKMFAAVTSKDGEIDYEKWVNDVMN